VISKAKRLQTFLHRLEAASPASSAEEAFTLLAETLRTVEDELSGVPDRPELWKTDGRMYPPQEDSRVKNTERPWLRKYRNKGHYDFIGQNGSIRIETLDGVLLLDKPGYDGLKTHDIQS
jgi:hypothetical protein